MDWSLLGSGAGGHVTFAPDEPGLRDRLRVATPDGPDLALPALRSLCHRGAHAAARRPARPGCRRAEQVRSALILRILAVGGSSER